MTTTDHSTTTTGIRGWWKSHQDRLNRPLRVAVAVIGTFTLVALCAMAATFTINVLEAQQQARTEAVATRLGALVEGFAELEGIDPGDVPTAALIRPYESGAYVYDWSTWRVDAAVRIEGPAGSCAELTMTPDGNLPYMVAACGEADSTSAR